MLLNDAERRTLLRFARDTIAAHLAGRPLPAFEVGGFDRRGGAFVTVHTNRILRGCIGYVETDERLVEVVSRCAISAATEDPRFPPLHIDELAVVELELSVMGPLESVADVQEIEVGRHGLIVRQVQRRGLLLPQVAIEWGWDRETFLSQTCAKAGLPLDAWRSGAEIFKFEADVFGEISSLTDPR
jgi:AmmeMemoRadiSam system protein A